MEIELGLLAWSPSYELMAGLIKSTFEQKVTRMTKQEKEKLKHAQRNKHRC